MPINIYVVTLSIVGHVYSYIFYVKIVINIFF